MTTTPENPKPIAWLKQLSANRWNIYCDSGENSSYYVGDIRRFKGWKSGLGYAPLPVDCLHVTIKKPRAFRSNAMTCLMFSFSVEAFFKQVLVPIKTLKESLPGIKLLLDYSDLWL